MSIDLKKIGALIVLFIFLIAYIIFLITGDFVQFIKNVAVPWWVVLPTPIIILGIFLYLLLREYWS
jgi:hypothetical protein